MKEGCLLKIVKELGWGVVQVKKGVPNMSKLSNMKKINP